MMRPICSADRIGVLKLQELERSEDGRALMRLIDSVCLAGEIAYQPGVAFDVAAFRCGCQQVAKILHEIAAANYDWDAIEEREKRIAERLSQQNNQERRPDYV